MTTWGLCATVLAPAPEILRFAAWHLEQGAHRLYLYLDAPNPDAYAALKAHPKIRVQTCDATHWKKLMGQRPKRHQVRQTLNATHAYARRAEVDWLIHMDVDEFLVPQAGISSILRGLPPDTRAARIRPIELLGGSNNAFKAFIPAGPKRPKLVKAIYPTFGQYLRGGFLSHVAGKLFLRTGLPDVEFRIHNAYQGGDMLTDAAELPHVDLAHCHAKSWEDWRASFDYRLAKGSYRAELKPVTPAEKGGLSLHDLFTKIEAEAGEEGLRAFYDEVIGDSPDLRARLAAHDLLKIVTLDLDAAAQKHFPTTRI